MLDGCMSMKKYGVFITKSAPFYFAALFPVLSLLLKQVLKISLDYILGIPFFKR
jgi:hypothetical protein